MLARRSASSFTAQSPGKRTSDLRVNECRPWAGGRIRRTGVTEYPPRVDRALPRLDVGRPYHLGPFLSFVSDELAELSGRARKHSAAQIGKPRLHLWIGKRGIDLPVELLDDHDRRGMRNMGPKLFLGPPGGPMKSRAHFKHTI